jgi:hypothetical protein
MDWREIRVSLIAAVALCGGGIVFGALIGSAVSSRPTEAETSQRSSVAASARTTQLSDSASEEASKLVLGNIANVPFQELYTVLSSRSPAELADVTQQLKSLPPGHEKDQKVAKFFKAWAHFDAIGALKGAAELESPASREKAISAVVDGADATAAEALAKTINAFEPGVLTQNRQRGLAGMAAAKWSELDAPSAAAFLDTLPNSGPMMGETQTIAENWAMSDPQGALAWAQQHDAQMNYPSSFAASGAIAGWWQKDAAAAEAYVLAHLGNRSDWQLASNVASQMFNSDPKRAIDWVGQLPNVEARRQADSMIAHQLSWSDPKGAADWAASLPDDVRSSVLASAVNSWAQNNAAGAAEWIGSLNGAVRDQAINSYIGAVSYRDPTNALSWANAISDPQMRDNSVDRVVRTWMQRDPQQASAWLQASTLPDDAKKRLLASAPPPGG